MAYYPSLNLECRFDSYFIFYALLAQLVEHSAFNRMVVGSSPTGGIMNINPKYTTMWDRSELVSHLEANQYKRVLDIGGSRTQIEFGDKYITHILDLTKSEQTEQIEKVYFIGDCCYPDVWDSVLKDVNENGKFDFVICTHTLEDLALPGMAVRMMPLVSKAGYIAVPSKYAECIFREGEYCGYWHHRWIYDIKENGKILGIPKSPLLSSCQAFAGLFNCTREVHLSREELQFFWRDELQIDFVENIDSPIKDHYTNLVH